MKKHNLANIVQMIIPHLTLHEDGSIITDRYDNHEVTLQDIVKTLSK